MSKDQNDIDRACAHRPSGALMSAEPANICITLSRRIWRVTLDGVFYGDYRSERHAVASAEAAARTLRAEGRDAKVHTAVEKPEKAS